MSFSYQNLYDPAVVTESPDFRVIDADERIPKDVNFGCAYNPAHEIHLVQLPKPEPREDEVLVHIRSTGICGSDCHFWKHGAIGPTMVVRSEVCAGHESAGEVVSVGQGVTRWKAGDRVCLEAGLPCSKPECDACRCGRYNGCPDMVFFSTPPFHGLLKRWHVHPQQWLHRLPSNMSFEEGALCEPLAVALAGIDRLGVRLGDPLLITGAGPIGLVSLLAGRAAGCSPIIITDINQERLDFARKLIPDVQTCFVDMGDTAEQTATKIQRLAGESKLKHALECTGVESSIRGAILSMSFGGKVMVIGVGKAEQIVPFMWLSAHEIDLMYLYRYSNQYPKAIRLISSGLIDIKPLITHRFPLESAVAAFHAVIDPAEKCVKVQIHDL